MGAGPESGSDFGEFVSQTASHAYARLFAHTGDFARAQELLAAGYELGFREWADRLPEDRPAALDRVVELACARKQQEFGGGAPPASSYSRSAKVRAAEEAADILKSFPDGPRLALFLRLVEELPDESITHLTGLTPADLQKVRQELRSRIAAWRPGDPEAVEVFERILRQHRLSPAFKSDVLGRLAARGRGPRPNGPLQIWGWRIFRGLVCIAAAAVFLEFRIPLQRDLRHFFMGDSPGPRSFWLQAFPMWLDPVLWMASLNLRWAVSEAHGGSLPGRLGLRGRLSAMRLLDHVGVCVLTWILLLCLRADDIDTFVFLHAPIAVRGLWLFATLFLVVQILAKLTVDRREKTA